MDRSDRLERLHDAARRVAGTHGLDVFDVQLRREGAGWVLRVTLDRPWHPDAPRERATGDRQDTTPVDDTPVGIEDCQRVSHDLSALLDVEDELTQGLDRGYTLEVSSPGLDRPLRHERDYQRFMGRLAKIVTREPIHGQSHFAGRLIGLDGGEVVLAEGRREHRIALALINRARLDVEF